MLATAPVIRPARNRPDRTPGPRSQSCPLLHRCATPKPCRRPVRASLSTSSQACLALTRRAAVHSRPRRATRATPASPATAAITVKLAPLRLPRFQTSRGARWRHRQVGNRPTAEPARAGGQCGKQHCRDVGRTLCPPVDNQCGNAQPARMRTAITIRPTASANAKKTNHRQLPPPPPARTTGNPQARSARGANRPACTPESCQHTANRQPQHVRGKRIGPRSAQPLQPLRPICRPTIARGLSGPHAADRPHPARAR